MVPAMTQTRQQCRCFSFNFALFVWLSSLLLFTLTPVSSWIITTNMITSSTNYRTFRITCNTQTYSSSSLHQTLIEGISDDDDETTSIRPKHTTSKKDTRPGRRYVLQLGSATMITAWTTLPVLPCSAGEVGRRITEAVTTSDLGVSVRRSVVRGAQIMDALDLRAEKFSDTFQLGSERSKQQKRPQPKRIPPLQPLDTVMAMNVVQQIDNAFCSITKIPPSTLQQRVQLVMEKVQPSFVRSGVQFRSASSSAPVTSNGLPITTSTSTNGNDATTTTIVSTTVGTIENGPQFNFVMYVHYKSYTEIWLEKFGSSNDKDFAPFQKQFEKQIGHDLLSLFLNENPPLQDNNQERAFYDALKRIDALSKILVAKGFVAQIDRTQFDATTTDATFAMDIADWSQQLVSDVSWSVALDNDITLSSQILLQEQGIRFYPNFIRCMIQSILQHYLEIPFQQRIVTEDYYLDTDYNSDPDKFEVKEVLININMENVV